MTSAELVLVALFSNYYYHESPTRRSEVEL